MPPQVNSPTRSSNSKRAPMTISRTVGKALADVMNKDMDVARPLSAESDTTGTPSSPTNSRAAADTKAIATATRHGYRTTRSSLDAPRGNISSDKSTPKLTKRPPLSSTSKSITRSQTVATPSALPMTGDSSPSKPREKPKSRASLTFRGLSSALQPKPGLPPSALPKYKPKSTKDTLGIPRSSARKRLSDWDVDKAETKPDVKSPDEGEDDYVTVERPISPLPRRATRTTVLPASLSVTPSPSKKGNILHRTSNSTSSTSPRPPKTAKTSAVSPPSVTRPQSCQSRPPSAASLKSERATPTQSARKSPSASRARITLSARRRPAPMDSSISSSSKLESSPGNPFHLPETSGNSLLSPPLSPFLEGISIDSVDAGDVSALLSSVVSPTKAAPPLSPPKSEAFRQTPLHALHVFPEVSDSVPPQTPISSRTISTLSTDPRQSILSLRQFLENSGDLEHLLTQPLPSIFTPDARERLLSFGFSPGFPPPPLPAAINRPEPQTPCPVPDRSTFTSISQVLFPATSVRPETEHPHNVAPNQAGNSKTPTGLDGDDNILELLKMRLVSVESQRTERDARIEDLEQQLRLSQEARERDAATLTTQVLDLNERLKEVLGDKEQESKRSAIEIDERLRDKDSEWERHLAQVQRQAVADQERLLTVERRKGCIRGAAAAWECTREIACSELDLLRSSKRFVQVTLAGLDVSIEQLRQ